MYYGDKIDIESLQNFKCSDIIEFKCTVCKKIGRRRKSQIVDVLKVKPAIYCSRVCSSKVYNPLKTGSVACTICNKEIIKPLSYIRRHGAPFYCSTKCSNLARPKKLNKQPKYKHGVKIEWKCKECNKSVATIPSKQGKYCSKACAYKNAYHPNSTKVHRCVYNGVKLDSGAELAFVKLLEQNNVSWVKNTKKYFLFKDSTGKERKYYPDFYLKDYNWWVEIKGKKYERVDDELRLKAVGNITKIDSQNINLEFLKELALPREIESR